MNKEQRKEFQELQKKLQEENEARFLPCYMVDITLFVDRETGVEYIKTPSGGFIPVLNADGKPNINKAYQEGRLHSDLF